MSEALSVVEQILDDHERIHAEFQTLGQVSGDVEAAAVLGSDRTTKDYFVPKSLDDQGQGLMHWKQLLQSIDSGLKAHFHKEETALSEAFNREGTPELQAALQQLLSEHDEINKRIAKLLKDADDIASGGAKIEVWEGKGWGMKINIDRLRQDIESHAERERELLGRMKNHLHKR